MFFKLLFSLFLFIFFFTFTNARQAVIVNSTRPVQNPNFRLIRPQLHFVELTYPKAYARIFTQQLPEGSTLTRLQSPLPYRRLAVRKVRKWLVSEWATPETSFNLPEEPIEEGLPTEEELSDAKLDKLLADQHIKLHWLWTVIAPNRVFARKSLQEAWQSHGSQSGFPAEMYFSRAADYVEQLPIARWLAAANIRPSNEKVYKRREVEAALAPHLGKTNANFRLLCYTFPYHNPTVVHTNVMNSRLVMRMPPTYMLYGIRVCFVGVLGDQLSACEDYHVLDSKTLIAGLESCRQPTLHYHATV